MKFKVGDKVTIRSDLREDESYMGFYVNKSMKLLSGAQVKIESCCCDYYRIEKDGVRQKDGWSDAMFVESNIETFFVGDPVIYIDKKSGIKKEAVVIQTHGVKRIRYDLDTGDTAYRTSLERVEGYDYSVPYNPDFKEGDYVIITAKLPFRYYDGVYFSNFMNEFSESVTQIKASTIHGNYRLTNERLRETIFNGLMLKKIDPGIVNVGDTVIYRDRIEEVSDIVDDIFIRLNGFDKPIRKYAIQPIAWRETVSLTSNVFGIGNAGDIKNVVVSRYTQEYFTSSTCFVSGRLFEDEFDVVVDKGVV